MNKEFYEKLLTAENKYDRLDGWWKAEILYPTIDLRKYKSYFLELLKDNDTDIALHAWQLLPKLVKLGIINREDFEINDFVRALREGDINGWWIGYDLYKEGIIPLETLKENAKYFENALKADPFTRISSWSLLPYLLELEVVSKPSEDYLSELLDSQLNIHVKLNVVYLLFELKEKGVIDKIDIEKVRKVVEDPQFIKLSEAYEKDWRKIIQQLDKVERSR